MAADSATVRRGRGGELTLRGLVLGVLLTLVFTAANVYLGLKVGLTFASSIPAAVISMAVLSVFPGANIRENNIVQTVASAAGALASIIFVLPGLVIVGWWSGFPFWTSFLICASGGVLGVLFTIPLRRALVTHSDLPYPEGVAAAEVLKVGSEARSAEDAREAQEGLLAVVLGSVASAGLAAFTATRIAAGTITGFFRLGAASASGYDFAYSLALFGAGHLVGLSVGMAMLLGLVIGWGGAVPVLTALQPAPGVALDAHVLQVWSTQVRFIGAGAIAVAAVWTLARLAGPVAGGLAGVIANARIPYVPSEDQTDRDMSGRSIAGLTVLCVAVIIGLVWSFTAGSPLSGAFARLLIVALPFALVGGFLVAAVCGYMAGLIGSSNSPISGVGILAVVSCSALLLLVARPDAATTPALIAFALFATAIVFAGATSSNDNLQDLKTGQLVGAAPWRQQVALIVGVIAASLVIPPILNLLAKAYGFAGAPNLATVTQTPLPAPQANLISALAAGVIGQKINWTMIGTGAAIGVALVTLDEFLRAKKWLALPPLAVGIGIYLPMSATAPVVLGSVVGAWYNARAARGPAPARAHRLGVLVASGMIVGESLFGVLTAGLIVALGRDAPLALVPAEFAPGAAIGVLSFLVLLAVLYGWSMRRGHPSAT